MSRSKSSQSVAVAMLGARRHYAVPRIIDHHDALRVLYTDFAVPQGLTSLLQPFTQPPWPRHLRAMLQRAASGIDAGKIMTWPFIGLKFAYRRHYYHRPLATNIAVYTAFNRQVIADRRWRDADTVLTFNIAGLEWLRAATSLGKHRVLEQTIIPSETRWRDWQRERQRNPDWTDGQHPGLCAHRTIRDRERAEWRLADRIICGSPAVRDGVAACGGPVERCVIVPTGVDYPQVRAWDAPVHAPRRVLFAGEVGWRKGLAYLLAAKQRAGDRWHVRVIGPASVTPAVLDHVRGLTDYRGAVPRSTVQEHMRWADVLVLPSLAEGSAMVMYEAVASGLPVVASEWAGVPDLMTGAATVVPAGDSDALFEAIESIESWKCTADEHARIRDACSLTAYRDRLWRAINLD